jgi:hypothetical protein
LQNAHIDLHPLRQPDIIGGLRRELEGGPVKELWRAGPLLQLSWVIALSTLLPLGAGILLDRLLHTSPLFILIGGLIGILAGTVGAVRISGRAIDALSPPGGQTGTQISAEERKEDRASC